jgi:hypothetical protein
MKNTANNYDYVLSLFRSTDEMRPAMTKVFKQNNFLLATDSHSLILVDESLAGLEYEEDEKAPNALGLFDKIVFDTEQILDRDTFLSDIFSLESIWIQNYKYCKKCKGTGTKTCPCCDNENDCEECDGSGTSDDVEAFTKPYLSCGDVIKLGTTTFDPNFLNRVLQVAYFLDEKQIIFKYPKNEKYKAVLFDVGKARIMIMPKITH